MSTVALEPLPPLTFKVAPHIVEDLGLNLYTTLSRVLVEYIANAYDADAGEVRINVDETKVNLARKAVKRKWEEDRDAAVLVPAVVAPLERRTLSDDNIITIVDTGHGMSRNDLDSKFLIAGRRRRGHDNSQMRSDGGRLLMGRKGLGKLAGFGIAQVITIESRAKDEPSATRIELRYDEILAVHDSHEIPIKETSLSDGGGLPSSGGTRIILSRLMYEPMGMHFETVGRHAGEHFAYIKKEEFSILLNDKPLPGSSRTFAYAWPSPDQPIDELISSTFSTEDGRSFDFQFRIRFTENKQALPAKERGVRVYAHNRLAAAPSLLDANTNMHGFRMTDYLDGIVVADFIDNQPADYIATDRQALRWESPLLRPLYDLLSGHIKQACYDRQRVRDEEMASEAVADEFTTKVIADASLSKKEEHAARRIAAALSSLHKRGYEEEAYQEKFKEVVTAMGRGQLLAQLVQLSKEDLPDFDEVIVRVTDLTAEQIDGFHQYVRGRIAGIEALRKIVRERDFGQKKEEKRLHRLFADNPWLINPEFFQLVTSDRSEREMYGELEKILGVNSGVEDDYDPTTDKEALAGGENLRPDLVFILGNESSSRIVIIELKAPNTPLYGAHLRQLQGYIADTKRWLKQEQRKGVVVSGILIGSMAGIKSKARDVDWLHQQIKENPNHREWSVMSIGKVLEKAESSHHQILKIWKLHRPTSDLEETEDLLGDRKSKPGRDAVADLPRNLRRKSKKRK